MQHLQVSAEDTSRAERPCVDSTIIALLKLCSSSKADIKIEGDAIEVTLQGGPASVQPTRRGRGAGARGGVSSLLWPDGFHWSLTVRLTDAESLSHLCDPPELLCSCSTCEDSSKPFETAAQALKFMDDHSGHHSGWSQLLAKQHTAVEQDFTQLLQQVQQHGAEGLVLPIQRAAALISVEAANMILLSDELAQNQRLQELALTILHHRIVWHMTSSYRPAKVDDFQQLQVAVGPILAPHLIWLIAGAPPYAQCASAAPDSAKHCSLEARSLVAYMRRCNLFQQPSKKSGAPVAAPNEQQLLSCLQQLLQGTGTAAGAGSSASAARVSLTGSQSHIDAEFVEELLALRGLTLQQLVEASDDTGPSSQLDFCVMCGSSSSTTQERLKHCKSCCHSYHASCVLAVGNADGSYTMQTYPKVREGICIGCQHFPLRTEAEGGFNWESAGEDAENEAAAAAAAGAAKHVARAKGGGGASSSGLARKIPGAAAIAAAVAAAAAADRAPGGSSSSGGRTQPTAAQTAVKPDLDVRPSKPLTASTAANTSSSSGAVVKPNKHLIRGPNGKFVSLKQLQQPSVSGTAAVDGSAAAAASAPAAAASKDSTRPGTSSSSKPKRPSSSGPAAAAAADRAATPAAAALAAAVVTPQGVSSSRPLNNRVVLCCEKLIPAADAPECTEPVDIDQLRQYVLDRLMALDITPTGDSGMLLRRALLKEGVRLDYLDNQNQIAAARFEVVTATAGRKGEKHQLLCHACVDRHLATWKEAEDHLAYDSGGHSTQFLRFVGTKVSVKDLWQQVQTEYKQSNKQQAQPQVAKTPISPAYDAAHALQMLASACALPFGEAAADGQPQPGRRRERKPPKERAAAAAEDSPTSSLNAADVAAAVVGAVAGRKRLRGDGEHRGPSSSNVSDTITAPVTGSPSADEIRAPKRQRRWQQRQQQEVDPLALRWRLARVVPAIRQQLEQLLLSQQDLQACAVLVDFWAPECSNGSGGNSPSAAAAAAAAGSSSPNSIAAAAAAVNWDLKAVEADGVAALLVDVARACLGVGGSTAAALVAAYDVLEFSLLAVKAVYSSGPTALKPQQGLLSERRQLVVTMLQLGAAAVSSSSSSSSRSSTAAAEVLAIALTAVCGSSSNAGQLQQLQSICQMLKQLIGTLSDQIWGLMAAAMIRHVGAAAAGGIAFDNAEEPAASAGLSDVHLAGMHALQQLLLLIKQSPAAWEPALLRICISNGRSSSSGGLAAAAAYIGGSSGGSVLEVMFEAFMQGYQLELQCGLRQQQQQPDDDADAADDLTADQAEIFTEQQQTEQQQEEDVLPADAAEPAEQQLDAEQPVEAEEVDGAAAGTEETALGAEEAAADAVAVASAAAAAAPAAAEADVDVQMTDAAAGPDQQQEPAAADPQQQQQEPAAADPQQQQQEPAAADPQQQQQKSAAADPQQQQQEPAAADPQQQQQQASATEAPQERLKAAEVLLGNFIAALNAAAAWLAATQQQQQQQKIEAQGLSQSQQLAKAGSSSSSSNARKAEDLLVNLIGLQYQVLHALLLTDTQLHSVLRFVNGGLHMSLVDYTKDMMQRATAAFEALADALGHNASSISRDTAAAAATTAAAEDAFGEGAAADGAEALESANAALVEPQQQQQQQQQEGSTECGVLAYDCKYVASTLAETVGYVVKQNGNKRT